MYIYFSWILGHEDDTSNINLRYHISPTNDKAESGQLSFIKTDYLIKYTWTGRQWT